MLWLLFKRGYKTRAIADGARKVYAFGQVLPLSKAKKTGAWKVKLFGIFQNPKPKEVAKTYTNIICTYLKNVYFY